jgi:hypothetical protein
LIGELRKIASERNAYDIFVQADGGEPAIALYESLGRREAVFHFDIEVAIRPRGRPPYRSTSE